jgi:ubiquinone/menaquinone biosynthesis C-methylase UbiE
MSSSLDVNLWSSTEHALEYLRRADSIPRRVEGEATLLEFVPPTAKRILDVGTGDGRLLGLVRAACPKAELVAIDFSPAMLDAARKRFSGEKNVTVMAHNFNKELPPLGQFDCVVSSFAIHHVHHDRKRNLYSEIFHILLPGGAFCNLEHVASPTMRLHHQFLEKLQVLPEEEDPSNKLLDLETQLAWLREIGFVDVDCHWKWRELALMVGMKPDQP